MLALSNILLTLLILCSDLWGLAGYYDDMKARREVLIEGLSLREQKSLGVASFSPAGVKKRRMDVEMTEEGVMELCVKYWRCVC